MALDQKQPSLGVLITTFSKNIHQSYKLQNYPCQSVISAKLLSSFIEITLLHGCSPVNLLHIFRTIFYKNTFRGLLLLDVLASFIATLLSWLTSLYIKEILIVPFHLKYFLVDTLQIFYTGNCLNFSTQIFNLKWPGWNWNCWL